jgi:hypothetical protein
MYDRIRLMAASTLCAALLAACSTGASDTAPPSVPVSLDGGQGQQDDTGGTSAAAQPTDADDAPSQPFELLDLDGLTTVTRAADGRTQSCMAEAGFPVASADAQGGRFDELIYRPEMFGPASTAQAESAGMYETISTPTETVWSNDPAYEAARSGCESKIGAELPGLAELERSYIDVINQLSASFGSLWLADPRYEDAVGELLDCAESAGYPLTDRMAFMDSGDFGLFGVEMGSETVAVEGEDPPADEVTTVVLRLEQVEYQPSDAEVDLAREWVRCRESTGFDSTMVDIVADAQAAALEPVEPTVLELNDRVAAVLDVVVEDGA